MAVLDEILGQFMGKSETEQAQQSGFLQQVLAIVNNKGAGLAGLVKAFQEKGLGAIAKSWVGTGDNQPVSAQQLESVFGRDQLEELATKAGISLSAFKSKLSELLPMVVDKLTPNGQVPDAAQLEKDLGVLPNKG
jgi:uncharacterized protein YidB (DUF937 family)